MDTKALKHLRALLDSPMPRTSHPSLLLSALKNPARSSRLHTFELRPRTAYKGRRPKNLGLRPEPQRNADNESPRSDTGSLA